MPFLIKIEGDAGGAVGAFRETGAAAEKMGEHGRAAHNVIAEAAEKAGIKHRELHRIVDMVGEAFGTTGRVASMGLFGPLAMALGLVITLFTSWRERIEQAKQAMEEAAKAFGEGFEGMLAKGHAVLEVLQKVQDKFDETQRKIAEAGAGDEQKRLSAQIAQLRATEEAREKLAKAEGASPEGIELMREHERGLEATATHVSAGNASAQALQADNAAAEATRRASLAAKNLTALGNPEERRKDFAKRLADAQARFADSSGGHSVLTPLARAALGLKDKYASPAERIAETTRFHKDLLAVEHEAKAFEADLATHTQAATAANRAQDEALAHQTQMHAQATTLGTRSDELGFAARQTTGAEKLARTPLGMEVYDVSMGNKNPQLIEMLRKQMHMQDGAIIALVAHIQANAGRFEKLAATVAALEARQRGAAIH
jgi:hypothetical protein